MIMTGRIMKLKVAIYFYQMPCIYEYFYSKLNKRLDNSSRNNNGINFDFILILINLLSML